MAEEKLLEEVISNAAQHAENANSRTMFKNHILVSQLLRNYIEMPIFAGVQPEDIEDVTEKYHAFLGVEFETDTVKKVTIHTKEKDEKTQIEKNKEVYIIPLLEHKSKVEYDIAMQLLRYMTVIWNDIAKKSGEKHKNKEFRYPMIVPIVYHEGKERWSADMRLADRIESSLGMEKYIPDFEYKVVSCCRYTEEELLEKHDEMSLIMLINRVQTSEEFHKFLSTPQEYVREIYGEAPKDIQKIIIQVLWSLLMKMGVPVEEAQEAVANMEEGHMGYLFENIEKMDIQEERRKTADANQRADAEKNRADAAEFQVNAEKNRADAAEIREKNNADMLKNMISIVIQEEKLKGHTKEETVQLLREKYQLEEAATELIKRSW